jgi:hypothetical protein
MNSQLSWLVSKQDKRLGQFEKQQSLEVVVVETGFFKFCPTRVLLRWHHTLSSDAEGRTFQLIHFIYVSSNDFVVWVDFR